MLNLDQVIRLKALLKEKGLGGIHMHDTCGAQYFSFEEDVLGTREAVEEFLRTEGEDPFFGEDGAGFSLRRR